MPDKKQLNKSQDQRRASATNPTTSRRLQRERAVPKMVYSVVELERILGLSKPTVLKLVRDGSIFAVRAGARWIIPKAALDRYLSGGEK